MKKEAEALAAARAAFEAHTAEDEGSADAAAYAAYSARCEQAVADFKDGNLSTSQFRAFLIRNGYTPEQASAEIEQRIGEKDLPVLNLTPNIQ